MTMESGLGCSLSTSAVLQAHVSPRAHPVGGLLRNTQLFTLASPAPSGRGSNGQGSCGRGRRWRSACPCASPPPRRTWRRGGRDGPVAGLRQHRSHRRGTRLGDVAVADLDIGVVHRGGEPCPGTEFAGGGEPGDVADLGHQGHRRDEAHPVDAAQRLHPRVGVGLVVPQLLCDYGKWCRRTIESEGERPEIACDRYRGLEQPALPQGG